MYSKKGSHINSINHMKVEPMNRNSNMDTDVVILAAGFSSRAQGFKMEMTIDGKAILNHVIDAFYPICNNIIIVGGYQIERVGLLVEQYHDKVQLVYNKDYVKGMFSSVKEGIAHVKNSEFFLTPGDYPLITTEICMRLLEYRGEIVKPKYGNRGGHPILLPSDYIDEILREDENSNLKLFMDKKKIREIQIEDESIVLDVDTPLDYQFIQTRIKKCEYDK